MRLKLSFNFKKIYLMFCSQLHVIKFSLAMASALQVILTEDSYVGKAGELVKVRPGFARNFLLRRKLAVVADKNNLKLYQEREEDIKKEAEEKRLKAEKYKDKIGEDADVTVTAKVGESGKLFGSVTKEKIVQAISSEFKIDLTKENIKLKSPIKTLGDFQIELDLGSNIKTELTVKVIAEK